MKIKDRITQWKKEGFVPTNPESTFFIKYFDKDDPNDPHDKYQKKESQDNAKPEKGVQIIGYREKGSKNNTKPKKGVQIIRGPGGEKIEIAAKGIVGVFSIYDNGRKITGLRLASVDGLGAIDEFVLNCDNDKETLMIFNNEEEAKKEYEKYEKGIEGS